jgi:hypothetical protein
MGSGGVAAQGPGTDSRSAGVAARGPGNQFIGMGAGIAAWGRDHALACLTRCRRPRDQRGA